MKTAVEYIIEELSIRFDIVSNNLAYMQDVVEKAKEMEKNQLGNCWDSALDSYERRAGVWVRASEDFDEYYESLIADDRKQKSEGKNI